MGTQRLSDRVCDSRPKGSGFEPHWRHCIVSLNKNINPSLVLVPPVDGTYRNKSDKTIKASASLVGM